MRLERPQVLVLVPAFSAESRERCNQAQPRFGIGVLQVLTTAPKGIVEQVPRDLARLGRLLGGLGRRSTANPNQGEAP